MKLSQSPTRPRIPEHNVGLQDAVDMARRSRDAGCDSLSDTELETFLYSAANGVAESHDNDQIADVLGAVDTAVRRRLGIWRVATLEPHELEGAARQVRQQADLALNGSEQRTCLRDAGSPLEQAASALADLLKRLTTEHPSEVRLPAEFYSLIEAVDDSDCLRFNPTEQQLTAAALLLHGVIVEMDAGEGKTLASAIAAAAFAASGRKVHILTANDYLATRDCDLLAPVLESLGLTVGLVIEGMDRQERRYQYAAQIVFTTAREVGFDYLRDSVAASLDHRVNSVFDVTIADEADHLLIDQARTPLIISGERMSEAAQGESHEALASELVDRQTAHVEKLYTELSAGATKSETLATILLAGGLTPRFVSELDRLGISTRRVFSDVSRLNDEYEGSPLEKELLFAIDTGRSALRLTEFGWEEVFARVDSPLDAFGVVQALRARVIHDAGSDYVLAQNGITLVDSLDGRPMVSHRYMHGLHEALESKEGLDQHGRSDTRARTSIRALMSNYATICGLTGTAMESEDAFASDYGVATVRVPPEIASKRVDLDSEVFFDKEDHLVWIVEQVRHWHSLGRPVLVTTGSVRESESISSALDEHSIPHRLLNAGNAELESEIVARGGELGAVTVSTGMAGRGTDFVVEGHSSRGQGLLVLITTLSESVRVERQIRGRTARQGAPGTTKVAVYINDAALAFSSRQGDLTRLSKTVRGTVEGPEVNRVLRQIQINAESQRDLVSHAIAEYEAVVEGESRGHYAERVLMMDSIQSPTLVVNMITGWVGRRTRELDDHRTKYETRFAIVSDGLWHSYRLDIGEFAYWTPKDVRRELEVEVHRRLSVHRDRLGAKRFALAVAECRLNAADDLWPARLAHLGDMATTLAVGATSRHAAVTELAEEIAGTRAEFWAQVEDQAMRTLLNSAEIASRSRMGDNHVEQLPDELEALLR